MNPNPTASRRTARLSPRWLIGMLVLIGMGLLLLLVAPSAWQQPIEQLVDRLEKPLLSLLSTHAAMPWYLLIPVAFFGGLIASLSPCILVMLPMNLGYIGTREVSNRLDALVKSGAFVLGVASILSLFGLFSSFAGLLMVQYRGHIEIAIGSLTMILGLGFGGFLPLPKLPGFTRVPANVGPFLFGLVFALISSPCASPVLFSVLGSTAATGNPGLSVLTMVAYSVGYTAVLFLAGVVTGFAKQVGTLKRHHRLIEIVGAAVLIATGAFYALSGIRWFA